MVSNEYYGQRIIFTQPIFPHSQVPPNSVIVKKGHNPNVDSYSAFFDNKKVWVINDPIFASVII